MKFYEIEIQTDMQGVESKGIYDYSTKEDAIEVFHSKMSSGIAYIKAGTLKKVMNMVINEKGGVEVKEEHEAAESAE